MSVGAVSGCFISASRPSQIHGHLNFNNPISRRRQNSTVIRCCDKRRWENSRTEKNYYELLGVSVDSNVMEIKEAYRKLQKKHHPDIAGQEGHEYTLMLNKAYEVLMKEDLRRKYDESIGGMRVRLGENKYTLGYSSWNGGCRECVHHASNTFIMDEALRSARVKVQYGDNDPDIEVSVESCPVNCIYWVETEELPVLEFLIQPQPKEGYGVFGGGWERPANVFMAAKSFKQQLKRHNQSNGGEKVEETAAQAEARARASMKIKMASFMQILNWVKERFGINDNNSFESIQQLWLTIHSISSGC